MTETYGASTGDGVRCGGGGGGGGLGDFSRVVGLGGSCIENGCRDSIISDGPLVGIDGGGGNGGGALEGGAGSDGKGGGASLGSWG